MIVGAAILLLTGCVALNKPASPPPAADSNPSPLNFQTVVELSIASSVTHERKLYRVRTECINFFVDHAAEADLRERGVKVEIIEALKSACVDLSTNVEDQEARRTLEQSIGPRFAAEQYYAAANAYMRAQRFGAAEGEIREAIRLDPANGHYSFLLGTAYARQGRCEIAVTTFEKVIQLDASLGYSIATAGHCFQLAGEWDKARAAYALSLNYPAPEPWRKWLVDRIAELPPHQE
jgi:Tfp pilus assembly protein PilF